MHKIRIKVWDAPIRLFHWALVIAIVLAWLSVNTELVETDWHWYTGLAMTFLLLFRLHWGFLGTLTARFSHFFPTPGRLVRALREPWQEIGHSPTAGLSVFAMLLLLLAMIVTGVFANDDITLQGPLASYVTEDFSDQMSSLHHWFFNGLLALVVLHLIAIAYYWQAKQHNLVPPMIHGRQAVPAHVADKVAPHALSVTRHLFRLATSLLLAAALTWLLFSPQAHALFVDPPPAPVAPASQHAW